MVFSILQAIPAIAGGIMMSFAFALTQKYGNKVDDPSKSFYTLASMDAYTQWRSAFIAGILFAASVMASIVGFSDLQPSVKPFESEKLFFKGTGLVHFMLSGLLIGFGTRLAAGALTKYDFYGIPKPEKKSIITMLATFGPAVVIATLRSSLPILQGLNLTKKFNEHLDFRLSFLIPIAVLIYNLVRHSSNKADLRSIAITFGLGNLLSVGIMMAGLARRHDVLDSISLNSHWSPLLLYVMIGLSLGNFGVSSYMKDAGLEEQPSHKMSARLLLGCALSGAGMGMTGLSPAAGLLLSAIYMPHIAMFFLSFIVIGHMMVGTIDRTLKTGTYSKSFNPDASTSASSKTAKTN